jgi:hypothetical protein
MSTLKVRMKLLLCSRIAILLCAACPVSKFPEDNKHGTLTALALHIPCSGGNTCQTEADHLACAVATADSCVAGECKFSVSNDSTCQCYEKDVRLCASDSGTSDRVQFCRKISDNQTVWSECSPRQCDINDDKCKIGLSRYDVNTGTFGACTPDPQCGQKRSCTPSQPNCLTGEQTFDGKDWGSCIGAHCESCFMSDSDGDGFCGGPCAPEPTGARRVRRENCKGEEPNLCDFPGRENHHPGMPPICGQDTDCDGNPLDGCAPCVNRTPSGSLWFSCNGPLEGKLCTSVNESADPDGWNNNYICTDDRLLLRWSTAGQIPGWACVNIREDNEPPSHTWSDNWLCFRQDAGNGQDPRMEWKQGGDDHDPFMPCVHWDEPSDPHGWNNNFLCRGRIGGPH